ncbi:MAG: ABC transporter ATP-binding protein, partial [Candidatus Omnitrophica bacterium]|nr:ABC transporter ATP-binding protein [Candidatus Omnitrophota bacterium]
VGTGFHPELTGRENVYLNGAILGMRKQEITRKFDEIVAFAEIEKFIDTPVKRYSSGMYVRLAFAVAAHLEPEILLVDEVLAVGDAAFQKKCLGKMDEVAKGGRTVLFVSHNMAAVTTLCVRSILLNNGLLINDGPSDNVIHGYLELGSNETGEVVWSDMETAPGNEKVRLRAVRLVSNGKITANVQIDKPVYAELEFINYTSGAHISTSIHLLDAIGGIIFATGTLSEKLLPGAYKTTYAIPANFLNNCHYGINAFVIFDTGNIKINEQQVISFTVNDTAKREQYLGPMCGVIRPKIESTTVKLDS